ncbi:hypothetical protein GCM10007874_26300 [Labrys miyagiensis]|uniref:Uncharacterized protein n=2 Tax=Labrys miyagiensis TaxID=346912 RepID=A0ABQ6CIS3_9HYPH|nr:hypothetical protein GCM10007874_26300 [Labrys miyagiensis]
MAAAFGLSGAAMGGAMCNDTAEQNAEILAKGMTAETVRVLITVKVEQGADRATTDNHAQALADSLTKAGAAHAESIGGQPLVVAELSRDKLLAAGKDARIACISLDQLSPAN